MDREVKKTTKKEKKEEPLIFLFKGVHSQLDEIEVYHAIVHNKTIDDGLTRLKKQDVYYSHFTAEKEKLMNEYNEKLNEFKSYQKEMFKILFD